MFGHKKVRVEARRRLVDPVFVCGVPGAPFLRVPYDPEVWVRFPGLGQDRTTWVEQVLAAYAEDYGWSADDPDYVETEKMLNVGANQPAEYTAVLLLLHPAKEFSVVSIDALDEEGVLVKYGDPKNYLDFQDMFPKRPPTRAGTRIDISSYSVVDQDWRRQYFLRAHKLLATQPDVHLIGSAFHGPDKARYKVMLLLSGNIEVSPEPTTTTPF